MLYSPHKLCKTRTKTSNALLHQSHLFLLPLVLLHLILFKLQLRIHNTAMPMEVICRLPSLEAICSLLIMGDQQAILLKQADRSPIIPHKHKHSDTFCQHTPLEQLPKGNITTKFWTVRVPEQGNLGVHDPTHDVNQFLSLACSIKVILLASVRLILLATSERYPGNEVGRHILSVLHFIKHHLGIYLISSE